MTLNIWCVVLDFFNLLKFSLVKFCLKASNTIKSWHNIFIKLSEYKILNFGDRVYSDKFVLFGMVIYGIDKMHTTYFDQEYNTGTHFN